MLADGAVEVNVRCSSLFSKLTIDAAVLKLAGSALGFLEVGDLGDTLADKKIRFLTIAADEVSRRKHLNSHKIDSGTQSMGLPKHSHQLGGEVKVVSEATVMAMLPSECSHARGES